MQSSSRPRNRQSGFGLLEMVLVFILVLVATVVVFVTYSSSKAYGRASAAQANVAIINSNIQSSPEIVRQAGWDTTTLARAGIFPAGMVHDLGAGPVPVDEWGGTVTVSSDATFYYVITYTNVAAGEDCVRFVTAIANIFPSVGVGASANVQDPLTGVKASVATIAAACDAAPAAGTSVIMGMNRGY